MSKKARLMVVLSSVNVFVKLLRGGRNRIGRREK